MNNYTKSPKEKKYYLNNTPTFFRSHTTALSFRLALKAFLIFCFSLSAAPVFGQTNCLQETFTFVLDGSGSNYKSSVGTNFVQHMNFNINLNFTFEAYEPVVIDADIIKYKVRAIGTNFIFFNYEASDTTIISGLTYVTHDNRDVSFQYNSLPYIGYMDFSICSNEIENLYFPLSFIPPIIVDSPQAFGIIYSETLNDSLRVQMAMQDPWCYLDDPYWYDINGGTNIVPTEDPVTLDMFTNNRFRDTPKLLNTAVEYQSSSFGKVCADGSDSTTILKLNRCAHQGPLILRIKEDPDNAKPNVYGSIIQSSTDCNTYFFKHPECLLNASENNSTAFFENITIEVFDPKSNQSIIEMPLRLYRAPVVMIHGLWSNDTAFDEMKTHLFNSLWVPQVLYSYDYRFSNSFHYHQNKHVGMSALRKVLSQAVSNDFSTSRVNVVGHSMGGILTRLFIQSDDYQNDIARFVTLNTPHAGSQVANLLEHILALPGGNAIGHAMTGLNMNPYNGAIHDLKVNGPANVHYLNGIHLNKNIVPSHTISTETSLMESLGWYYTLIVILSERLNKPLDDLVDGMDDFLSNYLFLGPHDLIVARSSQSGGASTTSHYLDQWHGSTKNEQVLNKVSTLLNAKTMNNPGSFSNTGFDPPPLNYLPDIIFSLPSGSGNLSIVSPAPGEVVQPGTTLDISVTGTGDIDANIVTVGAPDIDVFLDYNQTQSSQSSYDIPQDAFGRIYLSALGFGEGGFLDNDSLYIYVEPNASVDSVFVDTDTIFVYQGGVASIPVFGLFSDGITRNITTANNLSYTIANTSTAAIIDQGSLKGLSPGVTNLNVSFLNFNLTIPIVVWPDHAEPLLSSISLLQNISCYDNDNGSLQILAEGGFPGYQYLWSNGSNSNKLNDLTAGTYTVTVTDFIGQTSTSTITIEAPEELNVQFFSANESAPNANNGSINTSPSGGTSPYTYLWSNGDTTALLNDLSPGEYCLSLSDANGCQFVDCTTIISFCNSINSEIVSSNLSCFESNDGTANVASSTATAPVTYLWSTGSTSSEINGLTAGNYSVTITGAEGCSSVESIIISQADALVSMLSEQEDVACFGGSTGAATVEVFGGTPPYDFLWTDALQQTTSTAIDLSAGVYTVLIKDGAACEDSLIVLIQEPDSLSISIDSLVHANDGDASGAIAISIAGGIVDPSYDIQWFLDNELYSEEEDLTNLSSGTYVLLITDVQGCTLQETVIIDDLTAIEVPLIDFDFKIYPNPKHSNQPLWLEFPSSQAMYLHLEISDVFGRSVYKEDLNLSMISNPFLLSVPLTPGVYLVSISNSQHQVVSKKLLIQ